MLRTAVASATAGAEEAAEAEAASAANVEKRSFYDAPRENAFHFDGGKTNDATALGGRPGSNGAEERGGVAPSRPFPVVVDRSKSKANGFLPQVGVSWRAHVHCTLGKPEYSRVVRRELQNVSHAR